jgi:hypothetical protein
MIETDKIVAAILASTTPDGHQVKLQTCYQLLGEIEKRAEHAEQARTIITEYDKIVAAILATAVPGSTDGKLQTYYELLGEIERREEKARNARMGLC